MQTIWTVFSERFNRYTINIIASSTQFLAIFKNFDIEKIIEILDINPNLKKQNEDYRLNFNIKF